MLTFLEHVAMLVGTGVAFSEIVLVSMTQATTARILQKVTQNRGGTVCKRMRRLLIGKSLEQGIVARRPTSMTEEDRYAS